MTLNCPNCGQPILPGTTFCRACGTRVQQQANACARCGNANPYDAVFCRTCGNALNQAAQAQRPPPKGPVGSKNRWLLPGIGGGVVVGLLLIVVLMMGGSDSGNKVPSEKPVAKGV